MARPRDVWRYRELLANLIRTDLKVKYRGSVLGFAWSLLNPLLTMLVYVIAFRYVMRIDLENYSLFLLTGLLPWIFFSSSLLAASTCILDGASLLQKVYFPREVFPFSTVLFFFVQFLLALAAFAPLCLVLKADFAAVNLLYLGIAALLLVFTAGAGLMLSALTVFYRDVRHFVQVGVTLLFWLTPIVYPFEMVPAAARPWFLLNPLVLFVEAFHDVLFWNRAPGPEVLGGITLWAGVALVAGWTLFARLELRFAEEA